MKEVLIFLFQSTLYCIASGIVGVEHLQQDGTVLLSGEKASSDPGVCLNLLP